MKSRIFSESLSNSLPKLPNYLSANAGFGLLDNKIRGRLEDFQKFLSENRINPEDILGFVSDDGNTLPLHAASVGNVEIYDYLASLPGFNKDEIDNNKFNALQRAAIAGNTEMFQHLVEKYGFDPKIRSEYFSMLDFVIINSHEKMVDHLISHNLITVGQSSINLAHRQGHPKIAANLQNVLNLNRELSAAITSKDLPRFKMLCEKKGAKPKAHDTNLAEFAAINNSVDIFKYLVKEQNFTDIDKKYLTESSLLANNMELAQFMLLEQDFNPDEKFYYKSVEYNSFYDFSKNKGFKNEVAAFIKEVEEANRNFVEAVKNGDDELAIQLFSSKLIIKKNFDSALRHCASNGNLDLYKTLSASTRFNKSILNKNGHSLLRLATKSGNVEFVNYLLNEQEFSFVNEAKNEVFSAVLKSCPQDKRLEMLSYMIAHDAGFLFKDDFSKLKTSNRNNLYRLKDYSLEGQSNEIVSLIHDSHKKIIDLHTVLESNNEQGTISEFEKLKSKINNPYSLVKYLYKTQSFYPEEEYYELITTLTKQKAKDLYAKIAENEPELRFDYKSNSLAFYSASSSISIASGYSPNLFRVPILTFTEKLVGNDVEFFEFAAKNFGDTASLRKITPNSFDSSTTTYLKNLINSEEVSKGKSYTDEEVAACLIPRISDRAQWKNIDDPRVFYSFQVPKGHSDAISFSKEEQDFFNSVVSEATQDIIVPVQPISLTEEELKSVSDKKYDKNVFFIIKSKQPFLTPENPHHVKYISYFSDNYHPSHLSHKVITMPSEGLLNSKYAALHQLAIGAADLRHPDQYNSLTKMENCDNFSTTNATLLSHICDTEFTSPHCFNDLNHLQTGTKEFTGNVHYRPADIISMTESLLQQFPQLKDQARNFPKSNHQVEPYHEHGAGDQITLTHVALALVILRIAEMVNNIFKTKPKNSPTKNSPSENSPSENSTDNLDKKGKKGKERVSKLTATDPHALNITNT